MIAPHLPRRCEKHLNRQNKFRGNEDRGKFFWNRSQQNKMLFLSADEIRLHLNDLKSPFGKQSWKIKSCFLYPSTIIATQYDRHFNWFLIS